MSTTALLADFQVEVDSNYAVFQGKNTDSISHNSNKLAVYQ